MDGTGNTVVQTPFTTDAISAQDPMLKYIASHPQEILFPHPMTVKFCQKHGISVYATQDISENTPILGVKIADTKKVLNYLTFIERAKRYNPSVDLKKLHEDASKVPQVALISLLLNYERFRCDGNQTFYKEFIKSITPKTLDSLYNISPKILQEFQNSYVKYYQTKLVQFSIETYQMVKELKLTDYLPFNSDCKMNWNDVLTLENFQWGTAASFSRTFAISYDDGSKYFTMVPIVDYVNTAVDYNSRFDSDMNDPSGKYITSNRAIKRGEEITIEYSARNNYFVDYLFCMDNCTHCNYDIVLEHKFGELVSATKDKKTKKRKRKILESVKNGYFVGLNLNINSNIEDGVPLPFLRAVKLTHQETISDEEFVEVPNEELYNDKVIIKLLQEIFKHSLKLYSTSIEEDNALLEKDDLEYYLRCAIIIRRDEKRILENMIKACDYHIENAGKPRIRRNEFEVDEETSKIDIVKFISHTPIVKIRPNSIAIRKTETSGVGIFATRDIKSGEDLMLVDVSDPLKTISRRTYFDYVHYLFPSLKTKEFEEYINLYPQSSIISILLIYEKYRCDNKVSYFKQYVNHLSNQYLDNNIFQVDGRIWKEFQGSYLVKKSKDHFLYVLNAYHSMLKSKIFEYLIFPESCGLEWSKVLTLKEFQWGFAMAHSRTLRLGDSVNSDYALIPMMDFVNGNTNYNADFTGDVIKSISTLKDIKKGEEISIQYHSLNNHFLDYHFCMRKSDHILYEFSFKDEIQELLKQESEGGILNWISGSKPDSKISKVLNENPNLEIISLSKQSHLDAVPQKFVGVLNYLKSKNIKEKSKIYEEVDESRFDMMNSKVSSFKNLKEIFEKKLKNYPTSVDEDSSLLDEEKTKKDLDLVCAIIIRRDEKIILQQFIKIFKETLDYVEKIKS